MGTPNKPKYQYEVTVNNIDELDPVDIFKYMHNKFDNVYVPEYITSADELPKLSAIMAWSINVKAYFNTLAIFLDILKRDAKNTNQKDKLDQLICKEKIIVGYRKRMDEIYNGASRVLTCYIKQQEEFQMEGRLNNVQYGGNLRRA